MSIPKIIHYCWFGRGEKSELINKCIESWKKLAPDFQIIEWNEDNFDVNMFKYTKQAYDVKKYAFVSDVVRFYVLNDMGGIYLDTDVELLKPLDDLLENEIFMAYSRDGQISTGLIAGSEKNQDILKCILRYYNEHNFLLKNGNPNTTTVCTIVSDIFKKKGYTLDGKMKKYGEITLYSDEYFDPFDYENNKMYLTEKAYAVHYYAGTWKSPKDKVICKIGRIIKKATGRKIYDKIARIKHKIVG